ncbi:hypothetical protein MUN77_13020 [Leucobacter allii]|uniref:hypothetical protein n=1 Tax=Leucobacter allii TaxID=2932247 RepID=UPI001FD223F0|nr:hypothetical protein [Leucobacter allii]UOR01054.1 hypothetical protein MUN77_13020 [Leucobacter allii]
MPGSASVTGGMMDEQMPDAVERAAKQAEEILEDPREEDPERAPSEPDDGSAVEDAQSDPDGTQPRRRGEEPVDNLE